MIVSNPEVFDFSYIPEKFRFREKQRSIIESLSIAPLLSGVANTVSIYGRSGTGKTATARRIISGNTKFRSYYFNTISLTNVRNILLEIIHGGRTFIMKNQPYAELFEKIGNMKEKNILLILDEATNILKFDRDGIYNLIRNKELYGTNIGIIFITMDDPSLFLTEREKKSMGLFSSINFPRYSSSELFRIVHDRAVEGLFPGSFDDSIIESISEMSEPSGSARVAIELLQKSAFICTHRGGKAIEMEDLRTANSIISPYVTESRLSGFSYDDLMVLLALCRTLHHSSSAGTLEVMSSLTVLMEHYHGIPINKLNFYRIVRKLENSGIVEGRIMGKGYGKGVEKVLAINDIPVHILGEKIESMLNAM